MFAVILSELQSWRSKYGIRTLVIMISSIFVVSVLSLMKPDLSLQALTVFMIWFGWLSGKQSWSEIKYEEWRPKISLPGFLSGKLISVILLGSLHVFFALPALIMMMIMWSMPFGAFFPVIFVMIFSSVIAFLFNFIFNRTDFNGYEYLGTLFIIFWTVITIFFSYLNFLNPIIQIKRIIESGNSMFSLFLLSINVMMIFVLFFITLFFLNLNRKG